MGNAPVARCSICGKELKFFEESTPICWMCEQATPEEREVRSARKRPAVDLPKATEDDKDEGEDLTVDRTPRSNGNPG